MVKTMTRAGRASLPSVDRVLNSPAGAKLVDRHGRTLALEAVRMVLEALRAGLATVPGTEVPDLPLLVAECAARIDRLLQPSLRPVFNLSGTVLHTNLGRALYPRAAVEAAVGAMQYPVNLEYDLDGGARGERDGHVESRLIRLTGAQAAVVVNNNAAAVYLALNSLARRKEVLVSRGELVEIGGSFRIPDLMASAGCALR